MIRSKGIAAVVGISLSLVGCFNDNEEQDYNPSKEEITEHDYEDVQKDADSQGDTANRYFIDADGDGFGTDTVWIYDNIPVYVDNNSDCDDNDANTYPNAEELCDNKDNNCDGQIDENVTRECTNPCGTGIEKCVEGVCEKCNAGESNSELCNGLDDNCDGETDEEFDVGTACIVGICKSEGKIKCSADGIESYCDAPEILPKYEVYNCKDDDCDGEIDEGCKPTKIEWSKSFENSSNAHSVKQTADSGYIVAGLTQQNSAVTPNAWILKLDPKGNIIWEKSYGGDGWDGAESTQQTSDLGYIVAGWTKSQDSENEEAWILKLDTDGNIIWSKTYNGYKICTAFSIQQTADMGYIVAGRTTSLGTNKVDAWITKLYSDGNVEWNKSFGGSGNDIANSVQQTSDGGYIVAGEKNDAYWVFKLDQSGKMQWEYAKNDQTSIAWFAQQTTDSGYIVGGFNAPHNISKFSNQGAIIWNFNDLGTMC